MSGRISLLLWSWAAFSPFLFRALPGRDAAIFCLVAGWAFLPIASRPSSASLDGVDASSIHAVAIASPAQVNKATAIGLGCLVGLIVFDRKAFGRFRLDFVDVPMIAFCLIPLASAAAIGLPLSEALIQVRYLALAWGVPYLLGRVYLADSDSRGRFAVGLAAGGLAYLPLCLLEVVNGPTVYRLIYGAHPYEFEGSVRMLGYRPLGFQEHGNQLGMWMASSALVATWLWASGASKRPGAVPGGVLSAVLVVASILCQSHGSILLMGIALVPLLLVRAPGGRFPWRWAALVGLGLAGLTVGIMMARQGLDGGSLRLAIRQFFQEIRKSSFTWRLARTEEFLPIAWRHPWLGWSRADWRGEGLPFDNPVNLSIWLLDLGMYGLIGLGALVTTWLIPLIRSYRFESYRSWCGPSKGTTGALVALVVINFLDGFSNSTVILPVLAAVGGLNRPIGRPRTTP